jgi:chromosome segregation ATPase
MGDKLAKVEERLEKLEERLATLEVVQRTYQRFDILEKRLDEIMEMLKHHTYVGVPEQFKQLSALLTKIAEKLGVDITA